MTAITGKIGVTKRPGELGVHSMDCFNMIVPDLQIADDFYKSFGLNVIEEGNELGLYTDGSGHRWGSLSEGPRKKLSHLSFAVFEEDFAAIRKHIEGQGVRLLDPPVGFGGSGFWFSDPFGMMIEIKIAAKSSPNEKSDFTLDSVAAGIAAATTRSSAPRTRPKRLAHLLLFTPDVLESLKFYCRVLGLRLSDRAEDGVCFLHGIHGSDHHLIAFAKSNGPGLHHCSWDVGGINEIGSGAMHMADKGYSKGWGLGRHVLGSNYYHYVTDPWGSHAEYSADIDFIPLSQDWEEQNHDPEDSFYLWGPQMPESFIHNFEADEE